MTGPVRLLAAVLVTCCLTLTGACSRAGLAPGAGTAPQTLTVLAASSLTEAFTVLGHRFERTHPGVRVRLSFDASSTLAEQVTQGAPADVLATADQQSMRQVTKAHLAAEPPKIFATNTLVIVTPPGNPARITGVRSLVRPGTKVAVCAPEVPCGTAADAVLRLDRVKLTPVSLEPDVKSVLTKVTLGEVDAGIVYVSDARAAGAQVHTVALTNAGKVVNRYPIAVLNAAASPKAARRFVSLVRSRTGQSVLARLGFGPA
jgi:molybdate transport system substrate-binding protein